jgi:lysyl-tRNA synthetase class 2
MKPEKPMVGATEKDFEALGIRSELIPIILKLGIQSIAQLKEVKPSKLFNDLGGMRKKLKLENVQNPTLQEIEGWMK